MFFVRPKAPTGRRCAVYAALNHSGEIIYVGISVNPERRWEQHKCRQPWAAEIASWRILEWHDSEAEARARETALIRQLRTRWNIDESPVAAQVRQRYLDTYGWMPETKPVLRRPWPLRLLVWLVKAILWVAFTLVTGTLRFAWAFLMVVLGSLLGVRRRRRRRRWF